MTNVAFATIDEYNDLDTVNRYHELVDEKGMNPVEALAAVQAKSSDNARPPMQWSADPQAGFTRGTPWLKVNPNYSSINVEQALADGNSIFYHYQKLIQLRKNSPALVYGAYHLIDTGKAPIFAYTRTLDNERRLVVLNLGPEPAVFEMPDGLLNSSQGSGGGELLIGNYPIHPEEDPRRLNLRLYEARVYSA